MAIFIPILYAVEKNNVFSFLNNFFFIFETILLKFGTLIKKIVYRKICQNK